MLVLTRNKNESVIIGDCVEVTVVDICGGKIRLGITAPKIIPVHRKEVYNSIQKEKEKEKICPNCGYNTE
jgi:carbon storage regulator